MSNETIINLVLPAMRKNSRWKFDINDYLEKSSERFSAKISKDKKEITIFGKQYKTEFCKTFKVGDYAEYDSFNLVYYGEIIKISEKTVTIEERYSTRRHRLSLYDFISKNWNFDLTEVEEKNHETSMYI